MNRISVTTLEKFRRMMDGTSSFDTEESLVASLKGEFTGNDKTMFGSAYHEMVEGKFENGGDMFKVGDFIFSTEQAAPAINYRDAHRHMQHELPIRKVYETVLGSIQVTGRIDGVEGGDIRDVKTKFRAPADADYTDSYQWRFYLDMLEADTFYFDLFEIKGFIQLPAQSPYYMPELLIIPHEPLKCIRYEAMEADCLQLLTDFLAYLDFRNFNHLLKPALTNEDFII